VSTSVDYEVEMPTEEKAGSATAASKTKIVFFGIFGIENLGNECTLQSILQNARERMSDAEVGAISFNPADTAKRHHLEAIPVSQQNFAGIVRRGGLAGKLAKVMRMLRRIPGEFNDWRKAVKSLRGTDLVVMTGTGMLTDYMTTASGFPYDVFRWTAAARLAGCKVRFVGVGVGPIYGKLSRFFITKALGWSDYRSFRDQNSKDRIRKNGFIRDQDPVYPDLVFSLSPSSFPQRPNRKGPIRTVGLGVMDHRDIHMWDSEKHQAIYSFYLDTMADFVVWLIERKYAVRILQGDAKNDASTREELKARLEKRGFRYEKYGIIDEGSTTVEELIAEIGSVDLVVSPRFHNLLLGLMMNIPTVSISYDPKNDYLLDSVGLRKYCQPLEELNLQRLLDQFSELVARSEEVKPIIEEKSAEFRARLDEQYDRIFGEFEQARQLRS
jgi:polysaccharide pyruvyl transferase WcaK-like protein